MIEETFQNIKDINEAKFQDMRAELIDAHAIKNDKGREMNDITNQRIDALHAAVQVSVFQINALGGEYMTKLDANVSRLESRIHALSTSLEGSISDVSGNVQETVNINIKEKTKHISDDLDKLKRDLHNGMQWDYKKIEDFIKYTVNMANHDIKNIIQLPPGASSHEARDLSGDRARHVTPTAGAGNPSMPPGLQNNITGVQQQQQQH